MQMIANRKSCRGRMMVQYTRHVPFVLPCFAPTFPSLTSIPHHSSLYPLTEEATETDTTTAFHSVVLPDTTLHCENRLCRPYRTTASTGDPMQMFRIPIRSVGAELGDTEVVLTEVVLLFACLCEDGGETNPSTHITRSQNNLGFGSDGIFGQMKLQISDASHSRTRMLNIEIAHSARRVSFPCQMKGSQKANTLERRGRRLSCSKAALPSRSFLLDTSQFLSPLHLLISGTERSLNRSHWSLQYRPHPPYT